MAAKPADDTTSDHAGHAAYVPGCADCEAEFDDGPAAPAPSGNPYDRLHTRLVAPTRCPACDRTDTLTPAAVASAVGLSESGVRRLMQPDAQPSMSTLTKMAAALGTPAAKLLGELWPETAGEASDGQ